MNYLKNWLSGSPGKGRSFQKTQVSLVLIFLIPLNLLISFIIFSIPYTDPYVVYLLTTLYLFLLFLCAYITSSIHYSCITSFFSCISLCSHYILFSIPVEDRLITMNLDDYILCMGLIFIFSITIIGVIKYEKKLRRIADEKYRILVETATEAIFIIQNSRIKFPNPKAVDLLTSPKEELEGKEISEFVYEHDHRKIKKYIKSISAGTKGLEYCNFRIINKKGDLLWVQMNAALIQWDDKPSTLCFLRDITFHRKLESQIQQRQKLEAIGTLAAGIAHDFNNILSGIFGYIQLAKGHIDNPDRLDDDLDQIKKGTHKATDLIQQILQFSRQTTPEKKPLNITLIVKEAVKLLRASIPSSIDIKENLLSKHTVLADPGKIHQVIMNLCTNAYHAMADTGGTIVVRLKEVEISDKETIPATGIPSGSYVKLEVSDTGHGIDSAIADKIFEPYFTTKEMGKGTGLGLSVIRGIIEDHNGYIKVYSEKNKGTRFYVFLPIVTKDEGPYTINREEEIVRGGSETIMIIDDVEDIRETICRLLEEIGYATVAFEKGIDAFLEFNQAPDKYDLIITDMTMPGMNGIELSEKILDLKPHQKIFLCTGYSEFMDEKKAVDLGIAGYFKKPFIMNNLLGAIRSELDK